MFSASFFTTLLSDSITTPMSRQHISSLIVVLKAVPLHVIEALGGEEV
jgi:hypothetical protein